MSATTGVPTSSSDETLTTIAFGSCNHQKFANPASRGQPLWAQITKLDPQLYLWTGDAVYTDVPGTVEQVHEAYQNQSAAPQYQEFLATGVKVEGVYDDHDWGVNDAGGELSEHRQRMDEFLNFIGASKGDPRRQQNAIYSSHVFGPAGREVKVILLDTRTQRDPFLHLNIGLGFPAIQATWRLVTGQLCIGGHYGGDMLGEEQWAWLKGQLEGSTAAFHIIVSTVQVFTSCPIAESWGHFPAARRRLLQLLEATRPRGTMFISGDVHLAELISGIPPAPAIVEIEGNAKRHAPEREVLEVTSSGLTHSCAGRYGTTLCRTMLNHWNTHRPRAEAYYAWQNFGSARIDWGGCKEGCDGNGSNADVCAATATFNVHDAHGNIVLSTQRSSCRRWSLGEEGINSVISVLEHGQCAQNRAFVASVAVIAFVVISSLARLVRRKSKKLD